MLPSNVCRIGMPICINYISLFSLEESNAFIDMLHVFVFSRVNVDLRWVRHRYVNVWWMPVAIYVHISFIIASLVMKHPRHYSDVTMCAMASQITSLTIGYSTIYSGADQWKHQSSALLASVRGSHRGLVNSPHKWPVTRKVFPFHDVPMMTYSDDMWKVIVNLFANIFVSVFV